MVSAKTTIVNATGLHARPASTFVMEAKKYQCNITIKD
ncbi:MAG: HPr family phosphocarrier protein, partial [Atopobiaceae bacterium]|nr:HPr family phosphocarrier protein [Atopobiaceae bacterium]